MYRINRFFVAIIQLILLLESSKQSGIKQVTMAAKAIGNTIKSPLLRKIGSTIKKPVTKTFGNIKNSMGMFRRNKNTIKNFACGIQEKCMRTTHNFGSKHVKYLGTEAIKKFKYMAPLTAKGGNRVVRASGKQSIQMRSAEFMRGKEIGSLINMVSRSKSQLPFLAGGGLMRLTQFGLTPKKEKYPDMTVDSSRYNTPAPGEGAPIDRDLAFKIDQEARKILPKQQFVNNPTPVVKKRKEDGALPLPAENYIKTGSAAEKAKAAIRAVIAADKSKRQKLAKNENLFDDKYKVNKTPEELEKDMKWGLEYFDKMGKELEEFTKDNPDIKPKMTSPHTATIDQSKFHEDKGRIEPESTSENTKNVNVIDVSKIEKNPPKEIEKGEMDWEEYYEKQLKETTDDEPLEKTSEGAVSQPTWDKVDVKDGVSEVVKKQQKGWETEFEKEMETKEKPLKKPSLEQEYDTSKLEKQLNEEMGQEYNIKDLELEQKMKDQMKEKAKKIFGQKAPLNQESKTDDTSDINKKTTGEKGGEDNRAAFEVNRDKQQAETPEVGQETKTSETVKEKPVQNIPINRESNSSDVNNAKEKSQFSIDKEYNRADFDIDRQNYGDPNAESVQNTDLNTNFRDSADGYSIKKKTVAEEEQNKWEMENRNKINAIEDEEVIQDACPPQKITETPNPYYDEYTGIATRQYGYGNVFVGAFVNGIRQGKGKLTYANGDVYEGDFNNGAAEGQGTYTDKHGTYVGGFKNNNKSGYGEYQFDDGDYYHGGWGDNMYKGKGVFYQARLEEKFEGIYDKGQMIEWANLESKFHD